MERKFATLFGYSRAMLNDCGFKKQMRRGLWTEAAATATRVHNLLIEEGNTKSLYYLFYGKNPKYKDSLRTFGEVGIIAGQKRQQGRTKIENRGMCGIMVGYCPEHPEGTYRFYNPKSGRIFLLRDIQWVRKNYRRWKQD